MTVVATAAGVLLIAVALRDVFDALFHQGGGKLVLSRGIMRMIWWTSRPLARWRPRALSLAGPLALITVIAAWALLLALGWALIMWPHVPEGFNFTPTSEAKEAGFLDAIYLSGVTLATLGLGDVTPAEGWLKLLAPLEALIGFGLLTAIISWLLSVHPALARRRSLAYELTLLREAERDEDMDAVGDEAESAEGLFAELMSRIVTVERDLVMFPVSYYFSETDDRFSLAVAGLYMLELAERGTQDDRPPGVRLRAAMLGEALDDFAKTVADGFPGPRGDSTAEILESYAHDHLREPGKKAPAPEPVT
jgi:hypothetical protein